MAKKSREQCPKCGVTELRHNGVVIDHLLHLWQKKTWFHPERIKVTCEYCGGYWFENTAEQQLRDKLAKAQNENEEIPNSANSR